VTALTTIAPRLRKLVLMLSSNHDGEVVGAARAIGRVLKDAGCDWHTLADAISFSKPEHAPTSPPDDDDDWHELRAFCLAHAYLLSLKERKFIVDLGRWRRELTPRQREWLNAIYDRLRREAA
jgi:hypothetical protein